MHFMFPRFVRKKEKTLGQKNKRKITTKIGTKKEIENRPAIQDENSQKVKTLTRGLDKREGNILCTFERGKSIEFSEAKGF